MSRLSLSMRRDPFWEVDGPAARRERRRHRLVSVIALVTATGAVAGAAVAWSIQLGLAAGLGIRAAVPFAG